MTTDALVQVDALGPAGAYRARYREPVTDVTGRTVAEVGLVPDPYVARAMAALRKGTTAPLEQRRAMLRTAAGLFGSATLLGLGPDDYQHLVSRVAGLGITAVRASTEKIVARCASAWEDAQAARPAGAVTGWRDPEARDGAALWSRRGDVFGVHAAGNHPSVHAAWIQALALGYRVAVRPSRKEPFTPARLVAALREAGFGADAVVLLPTDHAVSATMLRLADLSMVYGGDAVIQRYGADPTVLPQGPGRTKILLAADADWRDHADLVDLVADSAARSGGAGCTNVTGVLVEGGADEARAFATALADRLATLPVTHPEDDDAVLPVHPVAAARALETQLRSVAADAEPVGATADSIVAELGDGSAALRPAVHLLASAAAPQLGAELPFPCVWVAPWSRAGDGVAPLRGTLVLTALTNDDALIDALAEERTIRNVYVGARPTWWADPRVPHDDYLAGFLMESRGIVSTA
ncbi:aldehyde dehydrogenase family protein [Jiangella mangrovi]|uniref:Acyl-CoA reductase-like NAD-dependent aldehyde dehydrogenase n=1 Tax=Jiangella mangrovi TaxID=1524084 RepID=A0A7W9GWU3_9ACTN|nr:aldehyde dehydrogenase family protein [Jiangella mangrovi]MBB5791236.1 acyl-CoA reductase-like NAD-dependent aldehyde dehydrogenase [Jiangella mangrovi]